MRLLNYMPASQQFSVNKLNQKGVIHLLLPLLLIGGIIVTVWLVTNGNPLKLFSKAGGGPIWFTDINDVALPLNSAGIPQSSSPSVKVHLYSTLGPPASVSGPIPGPTSSGTIAYRTGFDPAQLNSATYSPYLTHPTVYSVDFPNTSGTYFYWVDFKGSDGKVDRSSAQIEIVGPSDGGTGSGFGKAAFLNGTDSNPQYVKVDHSDSLNTSNNLTIEAWIKPNLPTTTAGSGGMIIKKGRSSVGQEAYNLTYSSILDSDGKVRYQYTFSIAGKRSGDASCLGPNLHSNSGTIPGDTSTPVTPERASEWKHVAGVIRDGSFYLYENGVKVAERTDWRMVSYCNNDAPFQIGAGLYADNVPSGGFKGQIDEVRVSNIVRYTSNFTKPTTPFTSDTNTVGLWHLDGNANDTSSSGLNGQTVGSVQFVDSTIGQGSGTPSPSPSACPTPPSCKGGQIVIGDPSPSDPNQCTRYGCQTPSPSPTFSPKPTPKPTPKPSPTSIPKPDLVVNSVRTVGIARVGRNVPINITVANKAGGQIISKSPSGIIVAVNITKPDKTRLGTCSVSVKTILSSGITVQIPNCPKFTTSGNHTITATVDSTNVVSESNEYNNTLSTTVKVGK